VYGEDLGAAVGISERDRDRHLAAQRGITRLELDDFDHLLVRNERHEAPMVRVGVGGRLAGPGRRVVGERDPEHATFAGVEGMDVTGHAGRHHPRGDRARIEQRAIDGRAGCVHVPTDPGRAHARTVARAPSPLIPHCRMIALAGARCAGSEHAEETSGGYAAAAFENRPLS
jgi:hypothetical protein